MINSTPRLDVTAQFDHPSAAQDAATALADAGFEQGSVNVFPGASDEVLRYERNLDPDMIKRDLMPSDNGATLGFVAGFLGGGLLGLMMGAGALNIMGKGPAMAVGPFWAAAIGAVVLGVSGALAGYLLNAPLPRLEPPHEQPRRRPAPTIVAVTTDEAGADRARETLADAAPARVTVWRGDNGDWTPLAV